jgi:8-oxo-dGTP diphosphatase
MTKDKNLRPKGAVGIYILNKWKQLLLLLRNSEHQGGKWCPPGGHIEYGEDFQEAAAMETKEESGIKVKKIEILGVTSDVYPEEKRHYITVHTKAVDYSGKERIVEPEKFLAIKWFDLNKLPRNLFPANRHFLSQNPLCLCGSGERFKKCCGK